MVFKKKDFYIPLYSPWSRDPFYIFRCNRTLSGPLKPSHNLSKLFLNLFQLFQNFKRKLSRDDIEKSRDPFSEFEFHIQISNWDGPRPLSHGLDGHGLLLFFFVCTALEGRVHFFILVGLSSSFSPNAFYKTSR